MGVTISLFSSGDRGFGFPGALLPPCFWVRIPDFSVEFYNEDVLYSVGQCLSKPLKLDMNTYWVTKRKYTRLCIEIEFLKPIISKVFVDNYLIYFEYENFSSICFNCCRIEHKLDTCPSSIGPGGHSTPANTTTSSMDQPQPANSPSGPVEDPKYGSWLTVGRKQRRNYGAAYWRRGFRPTAGAIIQRQGSIDSNLQHNPSHHMDHLPLSPIDRVNRYPQYCPSSDQLYIYILSYSNYNDFTEVSPPVLDPTRTRRPC